MLYIRKMCHSIYEFAQVLPPAEFSPMQMQVLRAAPEHVNLMHLNQFFFILSKHIIKLLPGCFVFFFVDFLACDFFRIVNILRK